MRIIFSTLFLMLLVSCGSNQESTNENIPEREGRQGDGRMKRPNPETIIAELDANNDGKLSKEEVKGPLVEKFTEIDTNKDGFISLEELKNAPKPERGGGQRQGGQRRQ